MVATRERCRRESSKLPRPSVAITPVCSTTDDQGSPFAGRAAALARKKTITVGTAITAQTHGRSCVAAIIGITAKPVSSTSEVQLIASERLASIATAVSATRSPNAASHSRRTVVSSPRTARTTVSADQAR